MLIQAILDDDSRLSHYATKALAGLYALYGRSRRVGLALLLLSFVFDPVTDSRGKTYLATLTVGETAGAGRMKGWVVSATDAYPAGEASVQGGPIDGDFAFRYLCTP